MKWYKLDLSNLRQQMIEFVGILYAIFLFMMVGLTMTALFNPKLLATIINEVL